MTEDLLHFIWKFKLLRPVSLCTTANLPLKIVHPGAHNTHAGPDFFNGRILLDGVEWAGNIEIHRRSSEWNLHNHQGDAAYDNVILHVVYEHDQEIFTSKKRPVPCLELQNYIDKNVLDRYISLSTERSEIPCGSQFSQCSESVRGAWLERMLVERLEEKTTLIREIFEYTGRNWDETFYLLLCRSFGFKVNSDSFLQLGRITPLTLLLKHAGDPLQVEALLFGQAGLLEEKFADSYPAQLQKEYRFLKHKYRLEGMPGHVWKFLRMRPGNFPTLRIAQLAAFIQQYQHTFSKLCEAQTAEEASRLFVLSASPAWNGRYSFKAASPPSQKRLGPSSIGNVLINTVCPLLFFYGRERQQNELCEKALDWYGQIGPENNSVTRQYETLSFIPEHAGQSQALLRLHAAYCSRKKCLACAMGTHLLKGKAEPFTI